MKRKEYYNQLQETMKGNVYWKKTIATQFKYGHKSWNKGINEIKIKCLYCKNEFTKSKLAKKKYCSKECYWKSMSGKVNNNWLGRKHKQETKDKISDKKIGVKAKLETKLKMSISGKNAWKKDGRIEQFQKSMKKTYDKKGRKPRERYHHYIDLKYKLWREEVFKRDNYTCQDCGKRKCYIEGHHIKSWAKYPKLRYIISNGLTLCKECHLKTRKRK